MNKKILAVSACLLSVVLIASFNLPAMSATNQSKEIQSLQKKISTLEANIKVLQSSVENLKVSNSKNLETLEVVRGAQVKKLSFVAYQEKDLICPLGSTPVEKLDGRSVQKGFPEGFSFKNIRLFGLLGGSQIDLGVCEINVITK